MLKFYDMTVQQLVDRGWLTITDSKTGLISAIRSVVADWNELSWAEQTYYRGKYRFGETGTLEIDLSEIHNASEKTVRCFVRDLFLDTNVTPDGALAGSGERLREILERDRLALECKSYDDSALLHIGPDGSAIYTNEAGWGPPLHWPDERIYAELNDFRTCSWEIGLSWISEAPCWACPQCNGF